MRNKIVAGNWKMNNDANETEVLLEKLKKHNFNNDVKVMVSPSFTNLQKSVINLSDSKIEVIAQNMNESEKGAYTGEVSPSMIKSIGVSRVIIGHSERRAYYNENDQYGFIWNDSTLNIDWPIKTPEISKNDSKLPNFKL